MVGSQFSLKKGFNYLLVPINADQLTKTFIITEYFR